MARRPAGYRLPRKALPGPTFGAPRTLPQGTSAPIRGQPGTRRSTQRPPCPRWHRTWSPWWLDTATDWRSVSHMHVRRQSGRYAHTMPPTSRSPDVRLRPKVMAGHLSSRSRSRHRRKTRSSKYSWDSARAEMPRITGGSPSRTRGGSAGWAGLHSEIADIHPNQWRRGWDSNPRWVAPRRFSRPMHSSTLPPLRTSILARIGRSGPLRTGRQPPPWRRLDPRSVEVCRMYSPAMRKAALTLLVAIGFAAGCDLATVFAPPGEARWEIGPGQELNADTREFMALSPRWHARAVDPARAESQARRSHMKLTRSSSPSVSVPSEALRLVRAIRPRRSSSP
jgi:hypothetical protein